MNAVHPRISEQTAIQIHLGAIFISLELSRSTWVVTSLSPGGGEKMSKHSVKAGDVAALFERFSALKEKVHTRTGENFPIIVIQEAGLDGFWLHRVLVSRGIESWVVDAASIATSRRRRRAKTDKIDGEALVRALLAYKRGEPRVCAMVTLHHLDSLPSIHRTLPYRSVAEPSDNPKFHFDHVGLDALIHISTGTNLQPRGIIL